MTPTSLQDTTFDPIYVGEPTRTTVVFPGVELAAPVLSSLADVDTSNLSQAGSVNNSVLAWDAQQEKFSFRDITTLATLVAEVPIPFGTNDPGAVSGNFINAGEISFVSTDGQSAYVSPTGRFYYPGTNSLFVFVDGVALNSSQYVEYSESEIRFVTPLAADRLVTIKFILYVPQTDVNIDVISADVIDQSQLREGLIWFSTQTKNFSIYVRNTGFKTFMYRGDMEDPTVNINVDSGTF